MDIVKRKVCLIMLDTDIELIKQFWERAKEANPAFYTDGKNNICAHADRIVFDKIHRDLEEIRKVLSEN